MTHFCKKLPMLAPASIITMACGFAADSSLIEPNSRIADRSLPRIQLDAQIIAARCYDTFWNTGDEALARASLAPNFIDNTLPTGRPQGLAGPLAASKLMRAAIPDLRSEIEQMIAAGDRVTHLRFRGHFTGRFGQIQGQGQTINFIATDIHRVADGRVIENWHIEDNLTCSSNSEESPNEQTLIESPYGGRSGS